ncbi:MAG: hypothetical protein AAGI89_07595 [Pseudomonadota bacterium]
MVVSNERSDTLRIWVNRRRFANEAQLKEIKNASDVASLVGVPADNARIDLEGDDGLREVRPSDPVHIENGMSFIVTRQYVLGGSFGSMDRHGR